MAAPAVTEMIEDTDVQGLVVRGYGPLKAARFFLLAVGPTAREAELARGYLRTLCKRINPAAVSPPTHALQIAFTRWGLEALEVPGTAIETFSREFLEGMADDVRAESLGDRGDNDPSKWAWGRDHDIHVLLMVYAENDTALEQFLVDEVETVKASGLRIVREQHTTTLDNQKEHFGWRDGLSMPVFAGVPPHGLRRVTKDPEWWTDPIKPGEFVLGYTNEYDCHTESPTARVADDPANHLPPAGEGRKDLGRNGTYLVYREMRQHVHELWSYLASESREPGADTAARAISLGAKMVGRWPSGAPLMTTPEVDDPSHATNNEFTYGDDPVGVRCPWGSHIRRANPRDMLGSDRDRGDSEIMVRKHQMIRRGRAFGTPLAESMEPRDFIAAAPDTVERGLHFICLVGHISRQFEFVQRSWIHSANFGGLFKDGDPITAARRGAPNANDEFTCPASPVRRKYKAMPKFTTLVGGAYFFLPGIKALRFIARHPGHP